MCDDYEIHDQKDSDSPDIEKQVMLRLGFDLGSPEGDHSAYSFHDSLGRFWVAADSRAIEIEIKSLEKKIERVKKIKPAVAYDLQAKLAVLRREIATNLSDNFKC
mgnify:CR=1 FL=1